MKHLKQFSNTIPSRYCFRLPTGGEVGRDVENSFDSSRMLMIGDSNTIRMGTHLPGVKLDAEEGRSISAMPAALNRALQQRPKPEVVTILGGTNDAGNLATIRTAYTQMIETARANGVKLVIGTLPPLEGHNVEEANKFIRSLAGADVRVVELGQYAMAGDGVHFTMRGGAKEAANAMRIGAQESVEPVKAEDLAAILSRNAEKPESEEVKNAIKETSKLLSEKGIRPKVLQAYFEKHPEKLDAESIKALATILADQQKIAELLGNTTATTLSAEEQTELKTLTPDQLLRKDENERLRFVTQGGISAEKLASGESKEITFNFDEAGNKELYLKTTAGQVLPPNVRQVVASGSKQDGSTIFTRRGYNGEFFSPSGARLKIHNGTTIKVVEGEEGFVANNKLEEFKSTFTKDVKAVLEEAGIKEDSEGYERLSRATEMAALKGVDLRIALALAKSDTFKGVSDEDFPAKFEEVLTQAHRLQNGMSETQIMKDGKLNLNLAQQWLSRYITDRDQLKSLLSELKGSDGETYYTEEDLRALENIEVAAGKKLSGEQAYALAAKYFPTEPVDKVVAIMIGESGLDPRAGNNYQAGHTGLMQISGLHRDGLIKDGIIDPNRDYREQLYDPETNMAAARWVFNKQGWGAWEAGPNHKPGYYAQNLARAQAMKPSTAVA